MREVTKRMIDDFKIKEVGYDFMGYNVGKGNMKDLTFHHTIIARRDCKRLHLPNEGYTYNNGSIILRTPHSYLHEIEHNDLDRFEYITSELIDINIQRKILIENLKRIQDCLKSYEREYNVKEEYTRRRILTK